MGTPPRPGSRLDARRDGGREEPEEMAPVMPPGGIAVVGVVPAPGVVLPVAPGGRAPGATKGFGPRAADDGAAEPAPAAPWPPEGLEPRAIVVEGDVEGGGLDGEVVVVVGGPDAGHRVGASEGDRGGGSDGVAVPSGS
jgi:hypothetical protein